MPISGSGGSMKSFGKQGNFNAADELIAPNYVRQDMRSGDAPPGPAGQKAVGEVTSSCW